MQTMLQSPNDRSSRAGRLHRLASACIIRNQPAKERSEKVAAIFPSTTQAARVHVKIVLKQRSRSQWRFAPISSRSKAAARPPRPRAGIRSASTDPRHGAGRDQRQFIILRTPYSTACSSASFVRAAASSRATSSPGPGLASPAVATETTASPARPPRTAAPVVASCLALLLIR